MEIVKVTWIDAQRLETTLCDEEEMKAIEPIECDLVGFLVFENKDKIIIAQERWEESKQIKYVTIIPKCSIIKIIYLEERREKNEKR